MIIDQEKAISLLNSNDVVALPTETVYGLAGRIDSEAALKKIFATKERPFFDPLIVHVEDIKSAQTLTEPWHDLELFLAKKFWPGPLTIIKKKNMLVSDLITSGLAKVAIRCPKHSVMQAILKKIQCPLAAPSANKFKSTSPTTVDHVEMEFNGRVAVVDGGPCDVGIESTVIEVNVASTNPAIVIYRPGIISPEDFSAALKSTQWSDSTISYQKSPVAPGQLEEHYRTKKSLSIHLYTTRKDFQNMPSLRDGLVPFLSGEITLAARELYLHLRKADLESTSSELILYFPLEQWNNPQWYCIRERLSKASSNIITE